MRYIYLCSLQIQNPTYLSLTSSCTIFSFPSSYLIFTFIIFIHLGIISYQCLSLLYHALLITQHLHPSASSVATIPDSISSALSSGHVTETIARFVIPLGATASRYSLLLFMYYVVLYLYSIRLIWMVGQYI